MTLGQWVGDWLGNWFGSGEPAPAGAMSGTATVSISGAATPGASGAMGGTAAIALSSAGSLTGATVTPPAGDTEFWSSGFWATGFWSDGFWGLLDQPYPSLTPGQRLYVLTRLAEVYVSTDVEQIVAHAEKCNVSVMQSIDTLRMLTKTPELSIKPTISRRASDKVTRSSIKREKPVVQPWVMQIENAVRAMTTSETAVVRSGVNETYVIVNTRENSVFVVESDEL